jgi:glycosyltransferase involved in cell wall biosynthesis
MKILWFTWKDRKNPLAGGAEIVNEELAKRLIENNHEVVFIVAGFKNSLNIEIINGYQIIRLGNRWTVYWQAYKYYRKYLIGWADLVIDEINTIPFFAKFYVKEKKVLFIHQLCREIWFYEMFFPLSLIGFLIEPIYLWFLQDQKVITVSESTKKDLAKFGFKSQNIKIISEGIEINPVFNPIGIKKFDQKTILSLGSIRKMKRTHNIIKAFEIAKMEIPDLCLVVVGVAFGKYGERILNMINKSKYKSSIKYLGKISKKQKIEIMQKSHLIAVTSVKEGWGLIVTEANSQGTPAVVYNVDGLRDAVKNKETGLVCRQNTPENLAENIFNILKNREIYKNLRMNAWQWSKGINCGNSYKQFLLIINNQ